MVETEYRESSRQQGVVERLVEGACWTVLRARRVACGWVLNSAYRRVSEVAEGGRYLPGARVSNIMGDRRKISVGRYSLVAGELLIFGHGGEIRVGDWCYLGETSRIWSANRIEIGDRVLISHNVNIHDCDAHPVSAVERHEQFRKIAVSGHPREIDGIDSAPVCIEDDVWIGFNATILKGVTIGARSIIAAGSIVTRDVPSDSVFIAGKVTRKVDEYSR